MDKNKAMRATFTAKETEIAIISKGNENDYISITDIAKFKNKDAPADVVKNWLRSRDTIEFLGLWEQLNNPNFKLVDFDQFRNQAGNNAFTMSPQKWISGTNAVGIISNAGRNGGTFAHKDIAFEFASWVSAEFKLYIIKEYQRLKADENNRLSLEWHMNRELAKINYKIHTDAIKAYLIAADLPKWQQGFIYADEADMLNVILYGKTAKQWKEENPKLKGNVRDYGTVIQSIIMANLETMNAYLVKNGMSQQERAGKLLEMVKEQYSSLSQNAVQKKLQK